MLCFKKLGKETENLERVNCMLHRLHFPITFLFFWALKIKIMFISPLLKSCRSFFYFFTPCTSLNVITLFCAILMWLMNIVQEHPCRMTWKRQAYNTNTIIQCLCTTLCVNGTLQQLLATCRIWRLGQRTVPFKKQTWDDIFVKAALWIQKLNHIKFFCCSCSPGKECFSTRHLILTLTPPDLRW